MASALAHRPLVAEFVGTGLLVTAVVGSGIMATNLTGDVALQLFVNAFATIAALGVLIWSFAPISGAHFNPAVTMVVAAQRGIAVPQAIAYVIAQITGAIAGVALANVMFGLPALHASTKAREGGPQYLGEVVATAGLLLLIGLLGARRAGSLAPVIIPAWIGSAYFVTVSTSFANPAVAIGRSLSDSFAGIAPASLPGFIAAQLVGAAFGAAFAAYLVRSQPDE